MAKKETVLSVLQEIRNILKPSGIIPVNKSEIFVRNSDYTVTDKLSGLTWGQTLPKRMTWEEAKKECEKIGYRLPTRRELESLIDITKYNPAIDKEIFPDTKTDDYYWTSDSVASFPDSAWVVHFYDGFVNFFSKDGQVYVRPVRLSQ